MLTLLLLMVSVAPTLQAGNSPVAAKTVRKQLAAEYAQIQKGFRRNDPSPWIQKLSSDFQLTLFNGEKKDREWVINYVRNNAKTFRIRRLTMTIKDLEIREDAVTAIVEQKSVRTFKDDQGQLHRLDVGALQRETWEEASAGWRLKAVQEWKILYVRKN